MDTDQRASRHCSTVLFFDSTQTEKGQTSLKFTDLPPELLIEILQLLSWKDILHMRLTCQHFLEVTKTRAIWLHLVDEHILTQHQPPRLERPIDMHTSSELEHLLLLWKSAEIGWGTDDGHPARERTFEIETVEFAHLVKGGRWFLVTTAAGAVTYYDLDAQTITGVTLIPDQIIPVGFSRILMTVDIDAESPMLKFTIGFSLYGQSPKDGESSRPCRTIQIWNVTLILNDSQHAVGLTATKLASLPRRPVIRNVLELSLLGPTIALRGVHSEDGKVYIFVIQWEQASGSSSTYPWRILHPLIGISASMSLLHGNRIFVSYSDFLTLIDYSTIKETTSTMPNGEHDLTSPSDYIWCTSLKPHSSTNVFRSCFTNSKSQFIIMSRRSLYTILIENTSDEPPVLKMMDLPGDFVCSSDVGSTRAIFIDIKDDVWLIRYPLSNGTGDGSEPPVMICKHVLSDLPAYAFQGLIMDEETGRVVLPGPTSSQKATVVDFALICESSSLNEFHRLQS